VAPTGGAMADRGWTGDAGGARREWANAERFRASQGLPPYRVSYWRAKFTETERPGPEVRGGNGGFVPVAVRDAIQIQEAATERRVEVTLPNGRVVTFAGTWEAAAIAPWLHALEGER
jgi:hypothetical protein